MPVKILIVEDDDRIRAALRLALQEEEYAVVEARDVDEGRAVNQQEHPDVLLVDIMLGGADGRDLIREIRTTSQVPIIVVSARGDTHDVVAGLEAGADDYLTKPIVMKELTARIRAVRRRESAASPEVSAGAVHIGDGPEGALSFSNEGGWLRRGDTEIPLTATEFRLLAELVAHRGQVLSREQLLHRVWGYEHLGDDRLVDVTVRRLRLKLEPDPSTPQHIITLRGLGYRLQVAP
ncbi:MAG TPA: response regulator transcription factor [Actinomycetes bacterium]|nr:response regulator transcription factor [Actinomycetes bacterium]